MAVPKLAKLAATAAVALLGFAPGNAEAQVYVAGYTNGLFCTLGPACVNPNTSALQQAFIMGTGATKPHHRLTYSNSQFAGLTNAAGQVDFSNAAAQWNYQTLSVNSQNTNNFGAFYLGGGIGITYASPFVLWINLVSPTNGALAFTGQLSGIAFVSPGVKGGVNLVFDTPTQGMSVFSNGNWATISVTVGDPTVSPETSGVVTGVISAHVTPEPVTLSLLGTGLLGLAGAARRRKKAASTLAA